MINTHRDSSSSHRPPEPDRRPNNPSLSNPKFEAQQILADATGEDITNLPLNEFIPGINPDIGVFTTVTVYGKRKSGKSVFIKWFLQFYKHEIPWYWVFTLTQLNSFYESWIAEKFIIPSFNPEALTRIMQRQAKAREMSEHKPGLNPRACVIWDDYNGKDIKYNDTLANYYYTGRHFFTLNIFAAQHITLTPPPIRTNTDLVVLFNTDYADSLEHYWRDFAGKLPKEIFYQLFAEATSEPNCFLAVNNDPKIPLSEKFFKGKAELLDEGPNWIVGCEEMWKENIKQLNDIYSGEYIRKFELAHQLAKHDPEPSKGVLDQIRKTMGEKEKGEGFFMPEAPPPVPKSSKEKKTKHFNPNQQIFPTPQELLDLTPKK